MYNEKGHCEPFTEEPKCCKCGGVDIVWRWESGTPYENVPRYTQGEEWERHAMHCRRCHYDWNMDVVAVQCPHPTDRLLWYDGSLKCYQCDEIWHDADTIAREVPHAGESQIWGRPALAAEGGEGATTKQRHVWDRDGERCINCGAKDWMDDPECTPRRTE